MKKTTENKPQARYSLLHELIAGVRPFVHVAKARLPIDTGLVVSLLRRSERKFVAVETRLTRLFSGNFVGEKPGVGLF